jgi:NAD(P)-dependent dehydrogenase (short-subunit alcohol dehydrogenase family)
LITGATKGIGLAPTQCLVAKGYSVVGIARNADKTFPGDLFTVDLADEKTSLSIFNEINQKYKIDGVLNNAGIALPGYLHEVTLADMKTTIDLNLQPVIQTMQIFTPNMIKQKWGRIVNIASIAILGLQNRSTYAAAKAAVVGFSRSCALELAETGVTVNIVAPGSTETELFRRSRPLGSEAEANALNRVPMKRFGKPEEIAATIAFLLSDDANFITGQTIYVDGGASIGRASF